MYIEQKRYNLREDLCFHFVESFSLRQTCSGKLLVYFWSQVLFWRDLQSQKLVGKCHCHVWWNHAFNKNSSKGHSSRPASSCKSYCMAGGNINQRVVRTWQSGLVQRIFPLGLDIGILGNLNISLLCFLFPRTTTNIIRQFSIIFTYFCSSGYTVLQAFSYGHWLCTPRFKQMTVCSMCSVCLATAAGLFFGQLL